MLRFQQEGSVLDATLTEDTNPGTPIDLGAFGYKTGLVGVAANFIPANTPGSFQTGGVFFADNDDGLAGTADDNAFYDTVNAKFVAAAGTDILLVGKVLRTFTADDAEVAILLNDKIAE